jgi:hypothetical protein
LGDQKIDWPNGRQHAFAYDGSDAPKRTCDNEQGDWRNTGRGIRHGSSPHWTAWLNNSDFDANGNSMPRTSSSQLS